MSEHTHSTDDVHEVDTGSFTISYRVHVPVAPQQLWHIAANPHRHHELDGSATLSTNVTGPARLAEGDTFKIWMRRFGLPYTLRMRVVEATPDREIAWQHPAKHLWRWAFAPADDGGTWVTETFDYTQVSPWMLRVWKRAGVFSANARDIRASLRKMQDHFGTPSHA